MRIIRSGERGERVRDIQHRLLALGARIDPNELDGTFGPSTTEAVRGFQRGRGLPADGLVGPETWGELVEAGYELGDRVLYLRVPPFRGDDVRGLQRRLNGLGFDAGREDGILGEVTDRAVREFQRNVGRAQDGIVGPETHAALERLRPSLEGPGRAVVREAEDVSRLRATLAGAVIAIDPAHGPADPGCVGPAGTTEAEATMRLALALADELAGRGAVPELLRRGEEDPEPSTRAKVANELQASLCISLHCDAEEAPGANAASCCYFGTAATHSPAGERLAERILAQLTSELGLTHGGTHRLALAILRETRMPAVIVSPCSLPRAEDEARLADEGFRRRLASSIATGIERFLGTPDR